MIATHHISVCICTFKRPELLTKLLDSLRAQRTDGLFTYSAVVADNDSAQSAQQVVCALASNFPVHLEYCSESQPNIAMTRNKAIQHADGDFIAFIDDDEFPADDWLYHLFNTCVSHGVAGVLGPVKPYFESEPPAWVRKGKFFDRPTFNTGYKLTYDQARTGNVLFKRQILGTVDLPFRPQFATAGEDVDFFRRMMQQGFVFIWCNEAPVYEIVSASRCNRSYLLKRALLRGSNFHKHPTDRLKNAVKSLIAVPCYTLALPFLALFGQHMFLKYLIKLFDHASRLLAYVGLSAVTRRHT
ncbi:MAG: glycosyltransferase family A protein [Candidatus Acidiferrum sp.]